MFNFDTTFTKGKNTYKIVNNEITMPEDENGWSKLSAVNGNALIKHWLPIIEKQVSKAIPSSDFETLLKEIEYLQKALSKVRHIKGLNCSSRNKDREVLEAETYSLGNKFSEKIKESSFSPAQRLVIRKLSKRSTDICSSEIQELYNPVTDDDSKLNKWWKELNAFNYKKYGINKENILNGKDEYYNGNYYGQSAKSVYNSVKMRIENFRTIVKEAGDDLLNWSDQKISLRFTKMGMHVKAWEISSFTSIYCKHLSKKGVKKEDKKKNTSKGKLEDIIKNGNPTQEDRFRYYKQASGYDATAMINELDLEHLYMIIDSDLKCVKSKLFDKWDKPSGDYTHVARQLCEKSVTKQDYKKIIKWATPSYVNEAFMIKHKDHASVSEVMEYCRTNIISHTDLINDDFYHTCLVKIPDNHKFALKEGLSWQYMTRMSEADKVKTLKRVATVGGQFDYSTLYGLYHNVNYNLIKDIILKDDDLLRHLSLKLVKENDHPAMVKSAKECANRLELGQKKAIFSKLTFDEKKEVITYNYKDGGSARDFTKAVKDLSDDENLDLLQSMIEDTRASHYVVSIFRHFKDTKNVKALREANKIVKAMENVDALPLDSHVIGCLSVPTKVEILNKGIYLKDDKIYHSYSNSTPKTSDGLGTLFFQDFRRQDVDKVYDSPVASEYRKFLAHTMSKDELELCAKSEVQRWSNGNADHRDLQESFFRYNIDLFSYSFLKQFKEKEPFKLVVGDRRDRSNKYFGEKLLEKMNVSQSIDFMFS